MPDNLLCSTMWEDTTKWDNMTDKTILGRKIMYGSIFAFIGYVIGRNDNGSYIVVIIPEPNEIESGKDKITLSDHVLLRNDNVSNNNITFWDTGHHKIHYHIKRPDYDATGLFDYLEKHWPEVHVKLNNNVNCKNKNIQGQVISHNADAKTVEVNLSDGHQLVVPAELFCTLFNEA